VSVSSTDVRPAFAREVVVVPVASAIAVAALGLLWDYLDNNGFNVRRSIAVALLGGMVGGTLGVIAELARNLRQSLQKLAEVSHTANVRVSLLTHLPLAELGTEHRNHFDVLCQLIGDALKGVRVMANVDPGQYLTYLRLALGVSDEWEGVQRFPIRWFKVGDAARYLENLRDKSMKRKVRLFLIEDKDEAQMREDIADKETLSFYWEHTGAVPSYWITLSELRKEGLPVVEDCALYDRRLLIQYDEARRVLSFEVGEGGTITNTSKLFSRLRDQQDCDFNTPFHKIPEH